jgi:hypothetical protein
VNKEAEREKRRNLCALIARRPREEEKEFLQERKKKN